MDAGEVPGRGHMFGVVVVGRADRFTDGYAQRDMAIRSGAEEAFAFALRGGELLRMDACLEGADRGAVRGAVEKARMDEGDLLVLVVAKDMRSSRASAASVGTDMV